MKRLCILAISMVMVMGVFISHGHSYTSTLNPIFDTYVREDTPTTDYNWSGNNNAGRGSYSSGTVYRTFLKFNLSGIPDNAVVTSAKLRMNVRSDPIGTNIGTGDMFTLTHVPYDVGLPNADNTPNPFNWNAAQALTGLTPLEAIEISSIGWKEWNLLAPLHTWNYSVDLIDDFLSLRVTGQEIGVQEYVSFYSINSTGSYAQLKPQLVIEYQANAVPIPPSVWLLGSGLLGLVGLRRGYRKLMKK